MPHARVKHIDTSEALAMPGVKAILTADDLPAPADSLTDNGTVIKASRRASARSPMEPLYQGEPILAVAAVDELTAAEAIEKIRIDFEPLPFVVDPLDTLRPGGPNPRTDGNIWVQPPPPAAQPGAPRRSTSAEHRRTEVDRRQISPKPKKAVCRWARRPTNGRTATSTRASRTPRWCWTKRSSRRTPAIRCLETRSAMAYWQNGKVYVHTGTQSTAQTVPAIARWLNIDPSKVVFISEYTGGGFGSKITGGVSLIIPALLSKKANAPVMMRISREEETFIGRARPSLHGPDEGRVLQGRPDHWRSTCS